MERIAASSNCKKVAIGVAVIAAVGVVCLATGGTVKSRAFLLLTFYYFSII